MKVEYKNSSRLLAVIGDPIAHSLSPLLQNTMLAELGQDALYLAIPVAAGTVGEFVAAAKTIGIRGFNLTMPHKEDILPYLSAMTEEASACGSVNSVRICDGKLEGHSTDGIGFRRSIQSLGWDFPGKHITVLGAGGAAKSIVMTAAASGAASVRVVNRTLSKAEALCKGHAVMSAHSLPELDSLLPTTDLLINTTPMGMHGVQGGTIPSLEALKPGAPAIDCIYAPALTPFMEEAKKYGHPAANGIGMLVYQAIYALEFFLNTHFDEETVAQLGEKLLAVSGINPMP